MFIYLFSVNIKPPRHRFGFSLAWGWHLPSVAMFLFPPIVFCIIADNLLKYQDRICARMPIMVPGEQFSEEIESAILQIHTTLRTAYFAAYFMEKQIKFRLDLFGVLHCKQNCCGSDYMSISIWIYDQI